MINEIYYTFLAGWCAEAAGARLEFRNERFSKKLIEQSLHMTCESTSGIYPGQITDDSEMEIALLSALLDGKNNAHFPIELIANKYIEWYKSQPFEIDQTNTFALLSANNSEDMLNNANEYNTVSESNGSLMRCIPLAIFGINREPEQIMYIVSLESELTHPNKLVGEVTGLYCVIISHILKHKIKNKPINIDRLLDMVSKLITNQKVKLWFNSAYKLTNLHNYDSIKNEGHVKHLFIFVIYFLRNINNYTYEQAISEVIQCGGDTNTNAKIVGNLFGAYYGDCVPKYMYDVVLNFDCTEVDNVYFKRPYNCSIQYALSLLETIIIN
jgi:ADP-ribosyl-[dinitrogen reductase] hydrolase